MRRKLSNYEQETIITFSKDEAIAHIAIRWSVAASVTVSSAAVCPVSGLGRQRQRSVIRPYHSWFRLCQDNESCWRDLLN